MSLVILIVCIFIVCFHNINQSDNSSKYRNKAEMFGEKTYFDSYGKQRAVETNELIFTNVSTGQRCGVYTNKIYSDPAKDRIEKLNDVFRAHNAPVYWGECKPYRENNQERHFHLREVSNGRMYKIIGNYKYDYSVSFCTPVEFTIAYLDEDHNVTNEFKHIPYNLYSVYKGITYFK